MRLKTKILLIAGGVGGLALLCTMLYITSEHHAYNVAVKRYRQKEYQAAVAILDRLSPKYQQSSRGTYLRSFCQYNLALEACGFKRYDESLKYLASIPETYMNYDDVKELRGKIEDRKREQIEKQKRDKEEQDRQKRIADAKRLEREIQEEKEARRRAEEQRLYGAALDARVNYSDGQVHITNLNSYDWVDVEFQINSGIISKGYFLKTKRIEAGEAYSVGIMQFANGKGERFNPFSMKPRTFTIVGHKPNGSVDVQSYEWN